MLKRFLSSAAVAAALAALPAVAAAHTYTYTCNSDGHYHLQIDGLTDWILHGTCGPGELIAGQGKVLKLELVARGPTSAKGKAVLARLEMDGDLLSVKGRAAPGAVGAPKSMTVVGIIVNAADVGPGFGAVLSRVTPDWKTASRK